MLTVKDRISDRLASFYNSKLYWFACIFISGIGIIFGIGIEAATLLILLMSGQFFVIRNCARMFYPITFLSLTLMNFMGDDIRMGAILVVGVIPVLWGMFYNIKKYNKKFRINSAIPSMLFVSLAITLGGSFSISFREYFAIGNLFYIAFLGFGMVALCILVFTLLDRENIEVLRYEFVHAVCDSGIFLGGVMIYYYLLNLSEFLKTQQIVEMLANNPFRNVAVGYYLLTMPFAFFCARRKFRYMIGGVTIYVACLVSGSRMGLLFGSLQFVVCMLYFIVTNKRRRRIFAVVLAVLLLIVFVMKDELLYFYLARTESGFINPDEVRIKMMKRALSDFLSAPLFGQGIGYSGNIDLYYPGTFEMHWYHNFVCQIVGSLGLFGIVAYAYQFYSRLKLMLYRPTSFSWLIFLMYIGALMSGITDTGIFTPFPTVFLLNCAFMLVGISDRARQAGMQSPHRPTLMVKDPRKDAFSKMNKIVMSVLRRSKYTK